MREEILFTVDAPYRPSLPVKGWYFGDPKKKSLALMGALRGNEIQQMYVCAQLIRALPRWSRPGSCRRTAESWWCPAPTSSP